MIAAEGAQQAYAINSGTTQRFHDLAEIDTARDGGRTIVSLFRAQPREPPFVVTMLERHPLGSQAFVPLSARPYLVVVATDPSATPRAFALRDGQTASTIARAPGTTRCSRSTRSAISSSSIAPAQATIATKWN